MTWKKQFRIRLDTTDFLLSVESKYNEITLSTALKFRPNFFSKWSFFNQNQQLLNKVEPFESMLRALLIAQCPYKLSSFLDLKNGSNRFRLFACDFRLFRFFFSRSACFSKVAPPEILQSWVKYYGKSEGFGKEFRWTKFNAVDRVSGWQNKQNKQTAAENVEIYICIYTHIYINTYIHIYCAPAAMIAQKRDTLSLSASNNTHAADRRRGFSGAVL